MTLTPQMIQAMNQATGHTVPLDPNVPPSRADQIRTLAKSAATSTTPAQPATKPVATKDPFNPFPVGNTDPSRMSHVSDIGNQAKGGFDMIKQGIGEADPTGKGGVEGLVTGVGKIAGGAASIVTSPLAPVFKPLSNIIQDLGNKLSDTSFMKAYGTDTASLPANQETAPEKIVGAIANYSNAAGTIIGADQAISAAPKALAQVQEFGQKADAFVNKGLTDMKTAAADNSPQIIDNYYKAIKPSSAGKATVAQKGVYDANIVDAVKSIAQNKDNLTFLDKNGEEITGQTPKSPMDMAHAIDQTKGSIFDQYDALAKKSDSVGAQVDTAPVADELGKVVNSQALKISHPEAIKYAEDLLSRISSKDAEGNPSGYVKLDNATSQELIKNWNSSLDAFYRNPTYDNASKAAIDAGVVRIFREQLGKTIEDATGENYTALKKQYGALSAIEKDVNKRATMIAKQQGGGLADYAQVFSGGDMVHGILSLNPALFAKGAAQGLLTKVFQYTKSPDRAIQNMFKVVDSKSLGSAVADSIGEPSIGMSTKPTVPKIPQDDLATMSDFTDYAAGSYKPGVKESHALELDASRIWERYFPNKTMPKTPQGIANEFGRVLEAASFGKK